MRALMETVLLGAVCAVFGLAVLKIAPNVRWVLSTVGSLAVLIGGAHIVEAYGSYTRGRIRTEPFYDRLRDETNRFERIFHASALMYLAVPASCAIGAAAALVRNAGLAYAMHVTVLSLIGLLVVALLCSLGETFLRMCDPYYAEPELVRGTTAQDAEVDYKIAYVARQVRSVYLAESLHNVVLVVVGVLLLSDSFDFGVQLKWPVVIVAALAAVFLCNQLPFMIGQARLHRRILQPYDDPAQHAALARRLREDSPIFPDWMFWGGQIGSGFVGAVLFGLIQDAIKNAVAK
jgi:hypothetical protein